MKPISIQLYSLREEAQNDFVGVLKRLAGIGYRGVEPAGFHDLSPAEFRSVTDDLGLVISSTHSPSPTHVDMAEVVDTLGVMGTNLVAGGFGLASFTDLDTIEHTAETLAGIDEALSAEGITFAMHNHWWEFEELDDRLKIDILAGLAPGLKFELDTYWAANFGANDPVALVAKFADRCPLLHIKDGPLVQDRPHTAVGSGKMDIPAAIAAANDTTQWMVVEADECATDMFGCVEASYRYLVGNGLAEGNRSA